MDVLAVVAQLSGALVWPLLQETGTSQAQQSMRYPWAVPVGLILASFGWWEAFVPADETTTKAIPFIRWMTGVRERLLVATRYFTYLILSLWKTVLFFSTAWLIVSLNGVLQKPSHLFEK